MTIDADFDQAIAHHQAGRFSEAESLYRNIIALNSKHAGALLHLGLIAHQSGKNPAALELIDQAIAAKPKYAEAHYNRGTILHLDKQLEKAAESFRQAARLDNNHIGALYSLAGVQHLLGQSDRAIKNYQTAAKKAPDQPEIHINLAVVFYETQRFEDALKSVEKALSLDPQSVEANFTRGNILAELDRTKEALNCYDMLLENDPDNTLILINKAAALQESNDPGEALAIYDQIIKLLPDQSEPVSSKANVLVKMTRLDEAIETFVQALAIAPTQAQTLYNQANLLLLLGGFDEGFPGLEKRFENEDNLENWERDGLKFWQGEELSGPLYLRAEQGVGDHLLWSTQIPQLQERGYDIVFECDPRLVSLIARSFPRVKVIAEGSKLKEKSDAARQIGMASVPYCLGDWSETFTPQNRVFEPDGDTAENLANELFSVADGRPIIGISWRSARRKVGPQKSLPLDHWRPILENQNALFVNLQYGETDAEIADATAEFSAEFYTLPKLNRMNDLDDFAALVDTLDLVITTSNVTAHFAGGLGKPCWLALQKVPLWYWGHDGEARTFYPSIEAYRQNELNDWSNVIAALANDLTEFLG